MGSVAMGYLRTGMLLLDVMVMVMLQLFSFAQETFTSLHFTATSDGSIKWLRMILQPSAKMFDKTKLEVDLREMNENTLLKANIGISLLLHSKPVN